MLCFAPCLIAKHVFPVVTVSMWASLVFLAHVEAAACSCRVAGKVDRVGALCLDGGVPADGRSVTDPALGPRPKILFQQQLYDVDAAALLLPAYLGNQRADAADVNLIDQHSSDLDLTKHGAEMNWKVELHLLALAVHERYRHLWRR